MSETYYQYNDFIDRVQRDMGVVIEKWKEHFARKLDETWEGFCPRFEHVPLAEMPEAIKDIVRTAKERLNAFGHRTGEASLLIRDPREDRLVLTYSTSSNLNKGAADPSQVKDQNNYYDTTLRRYVYPLHDTLTDAHERLSEASQRSRGLTGWVAVSGHSLLVNGEYGEKGLVSIADDQPETLSMCNTYGHPIWGRHISEAPSDPQKPKRYMAVPVKSSFDTECTIGVFRYACPRSGAELHQVDLIFISELAQLISAMMSIEAATTQSFRDSLIKDEFDNLRRTYDFQRFLHFITVSMRSSIASLYIEIGDISSPKQSKLRLVDAYGIRGAVGTLRNKIKDYPDGDRGFTRWLFDQKGHEPVVEDSVHTHNMWEGKNTEVFYGQHFAKLKPESSVNVSTELARKYRIKIVGLPIYHNEEKIGVLKVELPNRFDDRRHYGESDLHFIRHCATALGPVLEEYRLLIKGNYSTSDDPRSVVNYTRIVAQLLRIRLVSPEEAKKCWTALNDYFKKNPDRVSDEMRAILERLSPEDKRIIKSAVEWLSKNAYKMATDVIAKILTNI